MTLAFAGAASSSELKPRVQKKSTSWKPCWKTLAPNTSALSRREVVTGMREKILVAGSGIAGLGAALALGGGSRDVTILDRDPPPPEGSAEDAFYNWERKGATQLRHSHAFL